MPTGPAKKPVRIVLILIGLAILIAWFVFRLPGLLSPASSNGPKGASQLPAEVQDAVEGDAGVFDVVGGEEVAGVRLELLAVEHQAEEGLEAVALRLHNVSPVAVELWLGRDLNGRPNLHEVFELEVVDLEGNTSLLRLPEAPFAGQFMDYQLPLSVGASHTLRFGTAGPAGGEHPLLPFKVRVCYSGLVRQISEDGQRSQSEVEIWSNQLTIVRPWPLWRESIYKDAVDQAAGLMRQQQPDEAYFKVPRMRHRSLLLQTSAIY